MSCRKFSFSVVLAIIAVAGVFASTASAASKAVISPLGFSIANAPQPVRGTDGKFHLAYEITIVNQAPKPTVINSVVARSGGKAIGDKLIGPELGGLLRINSGDPSTIPGGGSALLFMDVTYRKASQKPKRLTHSISLTYDPGATNQIISFSGVPTSVVQSDPIVVEPPLRGPRWVAANGCCNPINAHRGATLAIDGTVDVPERFAIDFVQVQKDLLLFNGPLNQNSSYPYFGDSIHSATGGKVVGTQDGLPEQTPGSLDPNATVQTAGGNYVVVRVDKKHYAFYAHMQPGSLKVKKGDTVKPGQIIGKLGNTGNTDAAHLHFHIMDGPSPLESNGLPFVYDRFTGSGHGSNVAEIQAGAALKIDATKLKGSYRKVMPLGDQVVNFRG